MNKSNSMKVLQTFWSKPLFNSDMTIISNRANAGWRNYRYTLLSMAYSCLTISKYYPNIHLYTDDYGLNLLYNILRLPYHDIHTNLNSIDNIDESFWAYGKIITYAEQEEPFIHIDNDIFLWNRLPKYIEEAKLSCQSMEMINKYALTDYLSTIKYIRKHIPQAPHYIRNSRCTAAANLGIYGCNALEFNHYYCEEVKKTVREMYDGMIQSGKNRGRFNVIFEQLVFTELAEKENIPITCLVKSGDIDELVKYCSIETAQQESKYAHCLGILKRYVYVCEQIEYRMKYEYPTYYSRILDFLRDSELDVSENIKSMKRYNDFEQIYSFLKEAKSIEEVLSNIRLKVHKDTPIRQEGDHYIIKYPHGEEKLEGWCVFLVYFSDKPATGEEVCQEIFQQNLLPEISIERIRTSIFYMIMQSLYVTRCLTVV